MDASHDDTDAVPAETDPAAFSDEEEVPIPKLTPDQCRAELLRMAEQGDYRSLRQLAGNSQLPEAFRTEAGARLLPAVRRYLAICTEQGNYLQPYRMGRDRQLPAVCQNQARGAVTPAALSRIHLCAAAGCYSELARMAEERFLPPFCREEARRRIAVAAQHCLQIESGRADRTTLAELAASREVPEALREEARLRIEELSERKHQIVCPGCGERLAARFRHCPYCGARQSATAAAPAKPHTQTSARGPHVRAPAETAKTVHGTVRMRGRDLRRPFRAKLDLPGGKRIFLLAKEVVGFGRARHTTNADVDLVLRLLPCADAEHDADHLEKNRMLSHLHGFFGRWRSEMLVRDNMSINGIHLVPWLTDAAPAMPVIDLGGSTPVRVPDDEDDLSAPARVPAGAWQPLPNSCLISIGNDILHLHTEVLRLHGHITALRIRRLFNFPQHEYVQLFDRILLGVGTPPTPCAEMLFEDGAFALNRTEERTAVRVDGTGVDVGESVRLEGPHQLEIGRVTVQFDHASDDDFLAGAAGTD